MDDYDAKYFGLDDDDDETLNEGKSYSAEWNEFYYKEVGQYENDK